MKPCGKQDQYAAAYGGLNCFEFMTDGDVFVQRILVPEEFYNNLSERLMLFYTGIQRSSADVLQQQTANLMGDEERAKIYREMVEQAKELNLELIAGNWEAIGEYLHLGWAKKRLLADEISTPEIDDWYEMARLCGAVGGKLSGAGGGGFLLLYAEPRHHAKIETVLPLRSVMRADESRPSLPREDILANAPAPEDGCFRVPAVLE